MKEPKTEEEAQVVAEIIEMPVDAIVQAFGIITPRCKEMMLRLEATENIETMWKLVSEVPTGSMEELEILGKILRCTRNIQDLRDICDQAPDGSGLRERAIRKIVEYTSEDCRL